MVKTLERHRYALCEKHVIVPFCCSYQVYRYLAGCFGLISCRHYLEQDGVRLVARLVAQNIPKPPSVLRGDCDAIDVLCRGDIVAFINTTDEPQRLCTAEEMIDFMTGEPVGATEIGPFGFFVARRKAMRNDISE